jgi:hypothetical protein
MYSCYLCGIVCRLECIKLVRIDIANTIQKDRRIRKQAKLATLGPDTGNYRSNTCLVLPVSTKCKCQSDLLPKTLIATEKITDAAVHAVSKLRPRHLLGKSHSAGCSVLHYQAYTSESTKFL